MDLHARISVFIDSLGQYPPKERPAGEVADLFNVLLAEVQKQYPDDPIVATIKPAPRGATLGGSVMDAGSLTALARQLLGAVPAPPLVA